MFVPGEDLNRVETKMEAYGEKSRWGLHGLIVSWEKEEGARRGEMGRETQEGRGKHERKHYSRQVDISRVCLLSIRALLRD